MKDTPLKKIIWGPLPPAEESIAECIRKGILTQDENGVISAVPKPKKEMPREYHK